MADTVRVPVPGETTDSDGRAWASVEMVEVPTQEALSGVQKRLDGLEGALVPGPAGKDGQPGVPGPKGDPGPAGVSVVERPWERVVVTGGSNDTAVQAAMAEVLASAPATGGPVRKTLVFPAGDFHLTKPLLTGRAGDTVQLQGLSITGQGMRSTSVYWDNPAADSTDPLANNLITAVRRLRYATVGGFTVVSSSPKNRFAYLLGDTQGYNQGWKLYDLEFSGPWDRVFGIDGGSTANLNSEMAFDRIFTATNSTFRDAFFRSGGISGTFNQQNQFLNYWFRNCCFTLSAGTVIRLDKGGNVRVDNGSWSAASAANLITWFSMPNASSNNRAAMNLAVRGVKFEPKSGDHKIIDCSWSSGAVTFEGCSDHGSVQNTASPAYNLHRYSGATVWGQGCAPTVRYSSCSLAGFHQYDGPDVTQGVFVYDGCYVYRGDGGQGTTSMDMLRASSGKPLYRFTNCVNVPEDSNR